MSASKPLPRASAPPPFYDDFERIVERWLLHPTTITKPAGTAQAISERIDKRVSSLIRNLKIAEAAPPVAARQWKFNWDGKASFERVRKSVTDCGWKVSVIENSKALPALSMAQPSSGTDTIFLDMTAAAAFVAAMKEAGFTAEFTPQEALPILLARELYELAADQIGHRPDQTWVDELAKERFAQRVLGLPFCPLVLRLL